MKRIGANPLTLYSSCFPYEIKDENKERQKIKKFYSVSMRLNDMVWL